MPFVPAQLRMLIHDDGFSLLRYASADRLAQCAKPGYFNAAASQVSRGDLIIISAERARIMCVATSEPGNVVLAVLA